jgi:predicted Zn-dependent protease with MMP-like domain
MTLDQLILVASQVVEAIQRRLPAVVREAAATVPVSFELRPASDLVADGVEPDILGLFLGHEYLGELGESPPFPPQILLFVENIWDQAEGDPVRYRDEVRLTYLHELGHYLGWDESEIARRGLE